MTFSLRKPPINSSSLHTQIYLNHRYFWKFSAKFAKGNETITVYFRQHENIFMYSMFSVRKKTYKKLEKETFLQPEKAATDPDSKGY